MENEWKTNAALRGNVFFWRWAVERKLELVHIEPGRPVQNAHVESFHGKLRDECLKCELVREFVRGASEDYGVEGGVQRRSATQQLGACAAAGVRAANCSAPVACGSLRAAIRGTKRGRSHEFRSFERRMIPCAGPGGSSHPLRTNRRKEGPRRTAKISWVSVAQPAS